LEKKVEVREQTLVDREKRLTEKVRQLEDANSDILKDYNALLEKLETQEKAGQGVLKNKEKTWTEERINWKEQLDSLQQENRKYQHLM
jgi:hypothetical protein